MNTDLILQLYQAQVIEFGTFKLKTGVLSPFYLDLRVLVSHPQVLRAVAGEFARMLQPLKFDRLAAIPYAALPIGTAVALELIAPASAGSWWALDGDTIVSAQTKEHARLLNVEDESMTRNRLLLTSHIEPVSKLPDASSADDQGARTAQAIA